MKPMTPEKMKGVANILDFVGQRRKIDDNLVRYILEHYEHIALVINAYGESDKAYNYIITVYEAYQEIRGSA